MRPRDVIEMDPDKLTPEARAILYEILSGLAHLNGITAAMSEEHAVEALLDLMRAGLVGIEFDELEESFRLVLPDGLEVVTVQ